MELSKAFLWCLPSNRWYGGSLVLVVGSCCYVLGVHQLGHEYENPGKLVSVSLLLLAMQFAHTSVVPKGVPLYDTLHFMLCCSFVPQMLFELRDPTVKHRLMGMFAIMWRSFMPNCCHRMPHCLLAGSWILAFEIYWTTRMLHQEGQQVPIRMALILTLLTGAWWKLSHSQLQQWRVFQKGQQELKDEIDTQEALISMLCDASVHLGADGDTILRSSHSFDGLIEQHAQGTQLSSYFAGGQDDAAQLWDAVAGARKWPVALPMTLRSKRSAEHRLDLFVVRRADTHSHGARGFLVGMRAERCRADAPINLVKEVSIPSDAPVGQFGGGCGREGAGDDSRAADNDEAPPPQQESAAGILEIGRAAGICVKNTFLCAQLEGGGSRKRSSSAPPVLSESSHHHVAAVDAMSVLSDSTGMCTDWTMRDTPFYQPAPAPANPPPLAVLPDSEPAPDATAEDTATEITVSVLSDSTLSQFSQQGSDIIKLGLDLDNSPPTLSQLIRMKAANVRSLGSRHGPHERCVPCSFHFTHVHAPERRPPCRASYLCEYCHNVEHSPKWRSKLRKSRPPPDTNQRIQKHFLVTRAHRAPFP